MVKYHGAPSPALDAVFAALADPTRRGILIALAQGEANVGALAAPFDVSLPAISKHLRVLEQAGLLVREKAGRERRCRVVVEQMDGAAAWLERYRDHWNARLDALEELLGTGTTKRRVEHGDASLRRERVPVRAKGARRPRGEGPRVRA